MVHRRLVPCLAAGALLVGGLGPAVAGAQTAQPTAAAVAGKRKPAKPFVLRGRILQAGRGARVLVVGSDGSSASAPLSPSGRFVVRARSRSVSRRLMPKKGVGPTIHLIRAGKYLGPVLLATDRKLSKSRKGYPRLRAGLSGTVKLSTMRWNRHGFGAPLRALNKKIVKRLVSKGKPVRLLRGIPLGAGSQGATGRLRPAGSSAWSRVDAAGLAPGLTSLGADADRDGVPNMADVDMNGDQVLDAAQADSDLGGTLSGTEVLTGRPRAAIQFAKILNMDDRRSVNSNKNPAVTWADLTASIKENLSIETIIAPPDILGAACGEGAGPEQACAAARAVRSARMNCSTLPYCSPDSAATILAQPGSALDGKPLTDLTIAPGLLRLPLDSHMPPGPPLQQGFQLAFKPNVDTDAGVQFAGDAFEMVLVDGSGNELVRQAKVLTSSVATSAEWTTVGGRSVPADQVEPLRPVDYDSVRAEFYRPQMLPAGSSSGSTAAPPLVDRGGLAYKVYLISSDTNEFFMCRPSQLSATDPDLEILPAESEWDPNLYDTDVNPQQGDSLAFTLNVNKCLADPANPVTRRPARDSWLTFEMEARDADGNATRSRALLYAP